MHWFDAETMSSLSGTKLADITTIISETGRWEFVIKWSTIDFHFPGVLEDVATISVVSTDEN